MSVASIFTHIFGRIPQGIRFAINQSYVDPTAIPTDGDEVAFFASIGRGIMIDLTYEKIDVAKVRDAVVHDSAGAVLIFEGTTRNHFEGETGVRASI